MTPHEWQELHGIGGGWTCARCTKRPCDVYGDERMHCQGKPALRKSAVSWVEQNGLVLVVWNKRFHGWAMPGGMVEDGETLEQAQARELLEETALGTHSAELVFRAELRLPPPKQDRSSDVHFFKVVAYGVPRGVEDDCPITWLTWEALCAVSPFREFYKAARVAIENRGTK